MIQNLGLSWDCGDYGGLGPQGLEPGLGQNLKFCGSHLGCCGGLVLIGPGLSCGSGGGGCGIGDSLSCCDGFGCCVRFGAGLGLGSCGSFSINEDGLVLFCLEQGLRCYVA